MRPAKVPEEAAVVGPLGLDMVFRVRRLVGYRPLTGLMIVLALLGLLFVAQVMQGPTKMSGSAAPVMLLWEGAAGREAVQFVPIRILKVKRDDGGFLGIGQSPSMPGGFPDAREINAEALDGSGARLTLRAPVAYLPHGLVAGQRMVLGLTKDGRVIRFLVPGAQIPTEGLADWASRSAHSDDR